MAVLLVAVGLSGCFEAYSSDIVGTWHEGSDITWTFKKDDTLIRKYGNQTYTDTQDMDSRWIYIIEDDFIMKFSYELLNNGNTLLLESWEFGDVTLRK